MAAERFAGAPWVFAILLAAGCTSSSSPSPSDAGTSAAKDAASPVGDAAAVDSGGGGGSDSGGPIAWKSVIGEGGFFAQTFDDVTWSGKTITDRSLYAVACFGNLYGWAAGERGYVARTTDGGATWTTEDAHLGVSLRAIRFGSRALGVVAGENGALAVSHDGGASWGVVDAKTSATLHGAAVAADVGILVVAGDGGTLLRSGDTGGSWAPVVVPGAGDFRAIASDPGAHQVFAVDSLGAIWASTDGAKSFAREATAAAALDTVAMSENGARAIAAGAGGTALLRGSNGVWVTVATGTKVDLHAALVTDEGTRLYVAGEAGTLLTSDDDGARWSVKPLGTSARLYGLEDL